MKPGKKEPSGYTINALSEKFRIDRRTLKKYLANTKALPGGLYALKDVEEVLKAIAADKADGADLKAQKLLEEIRRLRLANNETEGLLVERAKVGETIRRIYGELRPQIENKLVNEWPAEVAGRPIIEAREYGKTMFDWIMAAHERLGKEWA